VLLDTHVTLVFVAVVGSTVAVNVDDAPVARLKVDELKVIEVTYCFTVTAHVPVTPLPSAAVAVIVAVPAATAVTTPEEETVATDVLLDVHVIAELVAVVGKTVAVNVEVDPVYNVKVEGLRDTEVTSVVPDEYV